MNDPLGLVGRTAPPSPPVPARGGPAIGPGGPRPEGPGFRETLERQIARVNELQREAGTAAEDLMTGKRDDVETVIAATRKADLAFRMLLQVRNKMMDAYEEVKQIRV